MINLQLQYQKLEEQLEYIQTYIPVSYTHLIFSVYNLYRKNWSYVSDPGSIYDPYLYPFILRSFWCVKEIQYWNGTDFSPKTETVKTGTGLQSSDPQTGYSGFSDQNCTGTSGFPDTSGTGKIWTGWYLSLIHI